MKKIKICGVDYQVVFMDRINDDDVLGEVSYVHSVIKISDRTSEDRQKQTLIHEMLHAIFFEAGLMELYDNEDVVNRVSTVLHQVLRDNDFKSIRKAKGEDG